METRDLSLAAALLAKGQNLEEVRPEAGHAVFRFEFTPDLQPTIDAFYGRRLPVDAVTYGECMRSAKSAAMAARNREAGLISA